MLNFFLGTMFGGFIATVILCCFMVNRKEDKMLEQDSLLIGTDEEGNAVAHLPITRVNNVEGLGRCFDTYYSVGSVVYLDNNLSVALKCITAGTTSNNELDVSGKNIGDTVTDGSVVWQVCSRTSDVTSVNGKTGDVVVGEVKDLSIDGTTVTVTFANDTTKTLATQDTVTAFKPDFTSLITISSLPFTAPSDCFVMITAIRDGNSSTDGQITVNDNTVIWFKNVSSATLGSDTTQFWVKKGDVVNVAGKAQFYKGLYCGGRV